jgi:tripartite-type tricarboxylate transporter receptor subunit TctC
MQDKLKDNLGQAVVVENKPAAGGILANALLAKAPADGYTLVVLSSTFTTGAAIRTNLPYDAQTSFSPVAMLAKGPLLITVGKQTSFQTLEDLIIFAKAHPSKLNYGTSGVGSINQFATEILAEAAQIKLTHVPYKGMSPAVTDLMGGQIDLLIASAPSLLAHVKGEKIRALAVSTASRSDVAPSIRSVGEAGYAQSAVELWWGVLAPAHTPSPVVQQLNATINQVIASDDMKAFFIKEGASPAPMSTDAFAQHLSAELARWKRVAQAANIQPE